MLFVSASGEAVEIFDIASFQNLSLDVFVLLFCLHLGFVNVSLSDKSRAAYKHFLNTTSVKLELTNKRFYKKPLTSLFIGFRSCLKLESMINVHRWFLKTDCRICDMPHVFFV